MGVPFVAGQRLTAADLNTATQQSAWTSYTPSWTSTGTAPVLGNGTIVGYYAKVGRFVSVRAGIYTGSTTTYGTGDYYVTLPLTAVVAGTPSTDFAHAGSWILAQGGGATFYTAGAVILQSVPGSVTGIVNGSGSFMGAANPVAFSGASAQFVVSITYETAS